MKYFLNLITFSTLLAFSLPSLAAQALDIALEMEAFQVEYYDASNTGQVRVKGCSQCSKTLYKFDANVIVTNKGKATSIDQLLEDQWSVKHATIFLNPSNNIIVHIAYN
jgi:hypothetical protein